MQDPLRYHVYVNGSRRGAKDIEFVPDEHGYTVNSTVSIRIDALFLTLYRYRQTGREQWRDGRLVAFEYVTLDNGTESRVSAHWSNDGYIVSGPSGSTVAVADAVPPSFWNFDIVKSDRVINPLTGEAAWFTAQPLACSSTVISGTRVNGFGYAIDGFVQGELWFDDARRSLAVRFAKNGYQVDAVRTA